MTFDTYVEDMKAGDITISDIYDKGDGTCLIVKRLMFHWTLLQCEIGDIHSYFERWCYRTQLGAQTASSTWISLGGDEPVGWHRHPGSGRRRPEGDATAEYVEW